MKKIEVVAAVIAQDNKIFATQRGYGEFKGYWEFPGGKIEAGETCEQALVREIEEELNTKIEVGHKICSVNYDYPEFHLTMHCFAAKVIEGKLELLEHMDACWVSSNDIDKLPWLPADIEVINAIKVNGINKINGSE